MKIFSVLLLATFMAGGLFLSETSDQSLSRSEKNLIISAANNVGDTLPPMTIQTTFSTKYPNASNVKWYRYTPAKTVEPGYWYSTLGPDDYYVSFNWNDADYIAWYDNGEWIYSTQQIDNSELPDAVRRAITTEYPGFMITDVDMENDRKQLLYEVKMQKGNQGWNVHYTPAGAVIKKKQKDFTPANVEATMVTDFETRYPSASEVVWYRYEPYDKVEILPGSWNYNMDATDYQVVFTENGNQYIAYYDNGAWVHSESWTFDRSKLPAAVSNAINTQYAGYTIRDVSREDNTNRVLYEVELIKGSDKCKIHYGSDGSIVKKKCRTDGVKTKM